MYLAYCFVSNALLRFNWDFVLVFRFDMFSTAMKLFYTDNEYIDGNVHLIRVHVRAAPNRSYNTEIASGQWGRRERKTFNDYLSLNAWNAITGSQHFIWSIVRSFACLPSLSHIVNKSSCAAIFLYLFSCMCVVCIHTVFFVGLQ